MGWGRFDSLCLRDMLVWTRTLHFFVETRTSRGVETRISSVGWIYLRTRISRLVLEMRELHSGTGRTRVSYFGTDRMWVSCLDNEMRVWGTWVSHSGTETHSSHCFKEMRVNLTFCIYRTNCVYIIFIYCQRARRVRRRSAFRLSHKNYWETLAIYNYRVQRGEWWQD